MIGGMLLALITVLPSLPSFGISNRKPGKSFSHLNLYEEKMT
jgi:hypothetical protein